MPDSSSVEYEEDEEEEHDSGEEAESGGEPSGQSGDEEDEEEELCSLAGSPRGSGGPGDAPPQQPGAGSSSGSLRSRITSKAGAQAGETFCQGIPTMPARPMMELVCGSNIWYQAYILRESKNEVKVRFPPFDCDDQERVEWVRKSSSRIWRGSYRNSQWKHLGRGAWAPKAQRRNRRRPATSKQPRRKHSSALLDSDATGDEDTGATGTDDADADGMDGQQQHASGDDERLSVLRKALKEQQQLDAHRPRAEHPPTDGDKQQLAMESPAAEEHSERGHFVQRGSHDCASGGGMVSNKDNCDRNSAKSNPSEFKGGIFSCSDADEEEDPELGGCGVDQADYDPLAKWFEVHFTQLHSNRKLLHSFPHGTPESGDLPAGFQWRSSGVVFAPSTYSQGEVQQGGGHCRQGATSVLCKQEPGTEERHAHTAAPSPQAAPDTLCERAAKLRKLQHGESSSGNLVEPNPSPSTDGTGSTPFKQGLLALGSPGASPTGPGSTAKLAVAFEDGKAATAQGKALHSPRKSCKDMPPGGSSQSESDVLHEKDPPGMVSQPPVPKGSAAACATGSQQRDRPMPAKPAPADCRPRPPAPDAGKAVKRKRAVIVSDDDEEDGEVGHVSLGPALNPSSSGLARQPSGLSSQNSEGHPPASHAGSAKLPHPGRPRSDHAPKFPGAAAAGAGSQHAKVARPAPPCRPGGPGTLQPGSSAAGLKGANRAPRKPAVLPAPGALRPTPSMAAAGPPQQARGGTGGVVPPRSASPVLRPTMVPGGKAIGGASAEFARSSKPLQALGHDRSSFAHKASTLAGGPERMLPHKKALLAHKHAVAQR